MSVRSYEIFGKVLSLDKRPFAGLRVEAWDKDREMDDLVGVAVTGADGRFEMRFDESYFRERFWDRKPDLYFKIYRGASLAASTERSVLWNVSRHRVPVEIRVDLPPEADAPEERLVSGRVFRRDGKPLAGAAVRALAKGVKSEKTLGKGETDGRGFYEIRYKNPGARVDLLVRVEDAHGKELGASAVTFNAGASEVVDVTAAVGSAKAQVEYEKAGEAIAPFLDGIAPEELTKEQAAYVKGASGLPPETVEDFMLAARMGVETEQPAELFYGLIRKDVPRDLAGLLARDAGQLRAALADAREERLISAASKKAEGPFLDALKGLAVKKSFDDPAPGEPASAGALMAAAPAVGREKAEEILSLFEAHEGTVQEFWQGLRKKPGFKDAVDDAQFSLQAGYVGGNHLPLVEALQGLRKSGKIDGWKDLAAWDAAEWKTLLSREDVGAPEELPGATPAKKMDSYADRLAGLVQEAFPTPAIAARVAKGAMPNKNHVAAFFKKNPDFDLTRHPLDHYLAKTAGALGGVPQKEQEAVKKDLRAIQRLSRVTPRYEEISVMMEGGVASSRAAARMGKDAFVGKFKEELGEERAGQIYAQAEMRYVAAASLVAKFNPDINVSVAVLTQTLPPEVKEELPDWERLFGSQDYCACDHCRSVLSPAAHFVDVLHFLKDRSAVAAGTSAKDVLFARRPDLGVIELSCDNTNVPLPYVDLANELLEEAVSPATAVSAAQRQTRATAAELAANPEHPNPEAYDALRDALYPWTLPFDLWTEETRVYLGHLGVDRAELMRELAPKASPDMPAAAAGEKLGLSKTGREIITGSHAQSASPWKFWGFATSAGWVAGAKKARELLRRSGLRYEDLEALMKSSFINPNGTAAVASTDAADPLTCDTNKLALAGIPDAALGALLDRMQRFVRVQRGLGWTVRELDAAFKALKPGGLDRNFFKILAAVQAARKRFGLEAEEVLAWYAPLDTRAAEEGEAKCLYERLFQNPSVIKRPAGETDPFALNAARSELDVQGNLSDAALRSALSAALGIGEADLALLADSQQAVVTADKKVKLENLSRLFRAASLSRALSLSVKDFLTARGLIPQDPFMNDGLAVPAARVEDTLVFADKVEKVSAAGTSFPSLDYLLRHQGTDPAAPEETALSAFLGDLRAALRENRDAAEDVRTESVAEKLAGELGVDVSVTRFLLSDWLDRPADAAHRLKADFLSADFWDEDDAATAARYPGLFRSLRRLHKAAALAMVLRLTPEELIWAAQEGAAAGWLAFQSLPGDGTEPAASFEGWERITDFFLWTKGLAPVTGASFTDVLMSALHVNAVASISKKAAVEKAALAAGWPPADLEALVGVKDQIGDKGLLGFAFPADFRDGTLWLRLGRIFPLLKRLGASAAQASAWGGEAPDKNAARAAKQAAKSKHDEESWLAVAKPLRDAMREKQRSSLVDYLVVRPDANKGWNWEDADGLYAYFLIDVQMCSCQMTSRLKQASAAAQLFTQRCLMNLERDVKADAGQDSHWLQWKWMKTYRVWEANRKVFLWPENWIEPELRDDKSIFFKELEEELMQGDIGQETAEKAFLSYADKVDMASRLEIRGVYHEKAEERDVLHVFGRTTGGQPYTWYYRRRELGWRWTAWEKVALDVQGGQLLPVVWGGRLRVFWAVVTEESDPDVNLTMPEAGNSMAKPGKIWKVQLEWSEYSRGQWAAKNRTNASLPVSQQFLRTKDGAYGLMVTGNTINLWGASGGSMFFAGAFIFTEGILEPEIRPLSAHPFTVPNELAAGTYPTMGGIFPASWVTVFRDGRFRTDPTTPRLNLMRRNSTGMAMSWTLNKTPWKFTLTYPNHFEDFDSTRPLFFQDEHGSYLSVPSPERTAAIALAADAMPPAGSGISSTAYAAALAAMKLLFQEFEHPFSRDFTRRLRKDGVDGLLTREVQLQSVDDFTASYHPEQVRPLPIVVEPYPRKEVDFSPGGAYSSYNWEIFFHVPLLIAQGLSRNQKFEEAQKWFHYIFDPMDASGEAAPQKFWRTRKFFETTTAQYTLQEIRRLLQNLAAGTPDPDLAYQVSEWRANPFKPHAVARARTVAFQKTVVMKYIDNLVAWGDSLFRQNTIESINEATQVYVLAAGILGRKPEFLKPRALPTVQTFNSLESRLRDDDFSDPAVAVESYVPALTAPGGTTSTTPPPPPEMLLFCVPRNEKLLGYWDLVADRLFKIRHCMDITGRVQQLPLFDPPIDPALLVKAAAAGVDLSEALAGLAAPLSPYRFQVFAQKASELCGEVKALGGALLAALEKKDAEAMALLRSSQEMKVLAAARQVKLKQVDEAQEAVNGLNRNKELIAVRRDYYRDILFVNPFEAVGLGLSAAALLAQTTEVAALILTGGLHLIPNAKLGAPPSLGATYGGDNAGNGAGSFGASLGEVAGLLNAGAALSNTMGAHERRFDDWKLQERLADKELEQMDRQIAGAEIRLAIARKELENHDLQADNAKEADAFMREKYTNKELYSWMTGQIATVYFQSYKLACDLAKRAEKSYRFELGLEDSDFIQPTYWDSLKKGLLSGEKLYHDLKRMEADFLDKNVREYELTKTVSLAMTDPKALVILKQTGECFFNLPEALFDMDHPGHYFRRLRSVAVSVPCVAGPYQGVHATLTLQANPSLRKSAALRNGTQYESTGAGDDRFTTVFAPAADAIATSTGREDAGLFETSMRDDRYLPFEGTGADSGWRLVLDKDANRFDFMGISDVVLHVRYTAREGGDTLRVAAKARLKVLQKAAATTTLLRLASLKSEFSDGWHRFLHPADTDAAQSLVVDLTDRLPAGTKIAGMDLFLKVKDGALPALPTTPDPVPLELRAGAAGAGADLLTASPLASETALGRMHHASVTLATAAAPGPWLIRATGSSLPAFLKKTVRVNNVDYPHLDPDKVEDLFLALRLVLA